MLRVSYLFKKAEFAYFFYLILPKNTLTKSVTVRWYEFKKFQ